METEVSIAISSEKTVHIFNEADGDVDTGAEAIKFFLSAEAKSIILQNIHLDTGTE
jgi:hypothetical protein